MWKRLRFVLCRHLIVSSLNSKPIAAVDVVSCRDAFVPIADVNSAFYQLLFVMKDKCPDNSHTQR